MSCINSDAIWEQDRNISGKKGSVLENSTKTGHKVTDGLVNPLGTGFH